MKRSFRRITLLLLLTLSTVLYVGWHLMTRACDGQNLSRGNSPHPIPECRFLPREGWNVLIAGSQEANNGRLSPEYGVFTRYEAESLPQPVPHVPIPAHPLMASGGNSMHNDAYESDVNSARGPSGIQPQIFSHTEGFGGYGTLTFDSRGRIVAVYGNGKSLTLVIMDPDTLAWIATYPLPGRSWYFPLQGVLPWKYIGAGMYFYLDNEDNVVVPTTLNTVQIIHIPRDNHDSFRVLREFDLSRHVVKLPWPKLDSVAWIFPEWPDANTRGHRLWYATIEGLVGTFEKDSGEIRTHKLQNEIIENSFAVGEEGLFVISDKRLYRMSSADNGDIQIDWENDYDYGPAAKPGLITRGSGSSVDLVGTAVDGLVIVTDNAEPRIHVEFYRRSTGEKVCSEPLFEAGKSATDLSVLSFSQADAHGQANGVYSVLIENNWGHHSFPYSDPVAGMTRVDAVRQSDGSYQCHTVWESQEMGIAGAKLSLGSGLVYMYTNDRAVARGWYFTALDFATGKTVWRQHTGIGHGYNAWQGVLFIHPDNGALYSTTIFGLVMMKDSKTHTTTETAE